MPSSELYYLTSGVFRILMYFLPVLQRGIYLRKEEEVRLTVYSRLPFVVELRPIERPMATADGLETLDNTNPLA